MKIENQEHISTRELFTKREWILRYASPLKSLLFMAMPMVIIMVVNSLYGIIDKQLTLNFAIERIASQVYSGELSGKFIINGDSSTIIDAFADKKLIHDFSLQIINISTQFSDVIILLLTALSLFTAVGTGIKWGEAMGKRDKKEMDVIFLSGMIQSIIFSFFGMIIMHYLAPIIIRLQTNLSESDANNSILCNITREYTGQFIWGFPLMAFASFLVTLLRSEGKVWVIIILNLIGVFINIFAGELIMEYSGAEEKMKAAVYGSMAAWSFIIISSILVILFSKNTLLRFNIKNIKYINLKIIFSIWISGVSPLISNLIFATCDFCMTLAIISIHDPSNIAYGVIISSNGFNYTSPDTLRILSSTAPWVGLFWAPIIGLSQGVIANYAYNKGANKYYRMVHIWKWHVKISLMWSAFVLVILTIFSAQMMKMFGFMNPYQNNYNWWFVAFMWGFLFVGFSYSAIAIFQGIQKVWYSTLLAVGRSLVCSIVFLFIGWLISRYASIDGTKDYWIFIFFGGQEFPASMVAIWLLWRFTKKKMREKAIINHKDDFKSPTILKVLLNEVEIVKSNKINTYIKSKKNTDNEKYQKFINELTKKYDVKYNKINNKYKYYDVIFGNDYIDDLKNTLDIKYKIKLEKIYNKNFNSLEEKNDKKNQLDLWFNNKQNQLNKKINKIKLEKEYYKNNYDKLTIIDLLKSSVELY